MTSDHPYCHIYFIRHGETDWNAQGRIQGHTDIPLNGTGKFQATCLGELLADVPFSAAFSSDLLRARQTAELIIKPRPLSIFASPALRERSAGQMEGKSKEEFDKRVHHFFLSEKALIKETYLNTAWHPELETGQSVLQRVLNFLAPHVNSYHEQSILVVSHSGVLRSLLDYLSFMPLHRWVIDNCGFIKVKFEQQDLHLLDCQGIERRQILL